MAAQLSIVGGAPLAPTTLRPYQQRAIDAARAHLRDGKRAVIIVLPTGGGKTKTAAEIIRRVVEKGGRAVFLAHRTELVEQAAADLALAGLRVGVISASSSMPVDLEAPVQVASTQTLIARGIVLDPTLVVLDECHHYPAEDWSQLVAQWPHAVRIGLSATPARQNGAGLSPMFDAIVVGATIRQLTHEGYLAPLDIVAPGRALDPGQIAQRPVDAFLEHANERQTVVFAPHVKAARAYLDDFAKAGVVADVIHGELVPATRARVLAAYDSGDTRVLINVGILTEGWDHPPTAVAILARRCGSIVLYLQIAGRILRPHPSKIRALFVDLTGAVHMHGRPDADRVFALEGRAIRKGEDAPPGSFCAVCGAIMDGAVVCIECGTERAVLETPSVVNTPVKLLAKDFCANDSASTQVVRLSRWIAAAVSKGHNPKSAAYKFKACYSRWPTRDELAKASVLA